MDTPFKVFENLINEMQEIPSDGILSRTIFEDSGTKVVMFGFAPGQALSEHTAARPIILHILKGQATVAINDESFEAGPGFWVHMTPSTPHSILAKSEVVMLLELL